MDGELKEFADLNLEIEYLPVDALKPYEKNARRHRKADVDAIAASISELGFDDPVGIWGPDNVIVEGHGRLLAAKKLGMERVPCIRLDHLSDEGRRAYALAHNRTAELSVWDGANKAAELESIHAFDMQVFGFTQKNKKVKDDNFEGSENEAHEPRSHKGDLYLLGNHLLIVGDATDKETVKTLMNGERADICFTSPPYNMGRDNNYSSAPDPAMLAGKGYADFDDAMSDEEYTDLLVKSLENALENADDVLYNIGVLKGSKIGICEMLYRFRKKFMEILIWNKSSSMPYGMPEQSGMVSHICEPIFCFNAKGSRRFTHPQFQLGEGINRIDSRNGNGNEYSKIHGATFPVEFAGEVIKYYSQKSVLDLFGGTGTTMIACEQLKRKCFMVEQSPVYCDVIIDRWEKFTGEKAVLLHD